MRILYVDDEDAIRRAVRAWLSRKGHTVFTAGTVADARAVLERERIDGILIDLFLGAESGVALHDWVRERDPALARRMTFVSGDAAPGGALGRTLRERGLPLLGKPFELSEIDGIVGSWGG